MCVSDFLFRDTDGNAFFCAQTNISFIRTYKITFNASSNIKRYDVIVEEVSHLK